MLILHTCIPTESSRWQNHSEHNQLIDDAVTFKYYNSEKQRQRKNWHNMRPSTALQVYNSSLYKVNAISMLLCLSGLFVKHSRFETDKINTALSSLTGFLITENDLFLPRQLIFSQDILTFIGQRENCWNRNNKRTCFIQVSPCGTRAAWAVYQDFETEVASNSSAMADFIMCTTASPTVMCQNAFPGCVSGTAFFVFAKVLFDFMPVC